MKNSFNVEKSDDSALNDYEESIMFDNDDPDFKHKADDLDLNCENVESPSNKMSVTSFQSMNNENLRNINDKVLDNIDLISDIEQAVTLEELKGVFKYCFRCGVNWEQDHVSLDCLECGGYSLERPCPICVGHCHNVWKRDLEESHRSGEATWIGVCSSKYKQNERDVNQLQCSRLEKVKATF